MEVESNLGIPIKPSLYFFSKYKASISSEVMRVYEQTLFLRIQFVQEGKFSSHFILFFLQFLQPRCEYLDFVRRLLPTLLLAPGLDMGYNNELEAQRKEKEKAEPNVQVQV